MQPPTVIYVHLKEYGRKLSRRNPADHIRTRAVWGDACCRKSGDGEAYPIRRDGNSCHLGRCRPPNEYHSQQHQDPETITKRHTTIGGGQTLSAVGRGRERRVCLVKECSHDCGGYAKDRHHAGRGEARGDVFALRKNVHKL